MTHVALVESGVAVRDRTFGQCIDALQVIDVEWAPGPAAGMSDESVHAALAAAELPQIVPDTGLLSPLGIPSPVQTRDFSFTFAFQPNCPLETNPCVADVRAGRAEIWGPMKNPVVAQQDIATALGLPQDAVTVHVVQGGGSFGRDLFWDTAREAALVSQAMGVPVKLSWTRTDDFRQGRAHPACRSSIRITRSETDIVSFAQHHTSVNTDFGHGLGEILTARADELPGGLGGMGFSQTVFTLTQYVPYDFGAVEQLLAEALPAPGEIETNVFRTGSMRNIYSPNVVTARELAIDQVAAEVGRDPLELRLSTLRDARSVAVLKKVAEAGSWGREMPAGTAQGLGFHSEYKGRAACLIEIDCRPETVSRTVPTAAYAYTGPRVTRAIYAVVPFETQVFILDSSSQPGGAGEFGVAASMAATANAYARATGSMPTSFPINHGMPLAESIVPPGTIPQSPTDGLGRR